MEQVLLFLLKNTVNTPSVKKVATGRYTVQVTLPTGYELLEDLVSLLVQPGRNNALRLSVVSKLALIVAVNQQKNW